MDPITSVVIICLWVIVVYAIFADVGVDPIF